MTNIFENKFSKLKTNAPFKDQFVGVSIKFLIFFIFKNKKNVNMFDINKTFNALTLVSLKELMFVKE